MARTKTNTQNDTKTRRPQWRNIHLEKTLFLCFKLEWETRNNCAKGHYIFFN